MRLVIVGASGLIGRELFAQARLAQFEVLGTCFSRPTDGLIPFNLAADDLCTLVPDLSSNDAVFLLSAVTDPNKVYRNPESAQALNLAGTKGAIDRVCERGARVIFMSSVEVFDGKKLYYTEQDEPCPLNLYGSMKYEIERYLRKANCRYTIVRTGWNVGWDAGERCVVKLTYENLLKSGAKMARDNQFSISDVRDTAKVLLLLASRQDLAICHAASAPALVRTELAELIRSTSKYGDRMSFEQCSFADLHYHEPRGRLNGLDASFARTELGAVFRDPREIVQDKVRMLDKYREANA